MLSTEEKIDARTITVKCSLETNVEGAPGKAESFHYLMFVYRINEKYRLFWRAFR
jgi:hypothetical protein